MAAAARRRGTVLAAVLAAGAAASATLAADAPRVSGLELEERGSVLHASFTLEGAFSRDILESIESGLPVEFRCEVEVVRRRPLWTDLLARRVLSTSVDFDLLTKQYRLTREVDGTVTATAASEKEEEMRRWMTETRGLPLGALPADVPRDGQTVLRARCQLASGFVLFFFPHARKTPWARAPVPAAQAGAP